MQLQLTVKQEYFRQTLGYRHDANFTLTPYRDIDELATATKFGIRLPFKAIVTTDQGRSVCPQCGAVYAGYQPYCDRQVRFVSVKKDYSHDEVFSETANIGDRIKGEYGSYMYPVVSAKQDVCKGNLKWDLQDEFYKQQRFFTMLGYVRASEQNNPFDEFGDCFLPGVQQHLELRVAKASLDMLTHTVQRHHGALEQIAQKMQHAGQALCF